MENYTTNIEVTECFHSCPLFDNSLDGMACGHPYWKDKNVYENMIIRQDNSRNTVPPKCPLRQNDVEIVKVIKLNNELKTNITSKS